MANNVRNYTDDEIIDRVEGLSTFKGWKKGVYDIWIRSTEDAYDKFDDKAYTFEVEVADGKPKFVMMREGTTNTGSYGLQNFKDYNHEGAAVLKSDWMIYGSHTSGLHKGKAGYRQAKPWPYFRDNNRNKRAEEIGPEHNDIIGANIHRAGVDSTVINNWSTACLVTAKLAVFLAWLAYMHAEGKPPLNVAILKEFDPATTKKPAGNKVSATSSSKPTNGAVAKAGSENDKEDLSQSNGSSTSTPAPMMTVPALSAAPTDKPPDKPPEEESTLTKIGNKANALYTVFASMLSGVIAWFSGASTEIIIAVTAAVISLGGLYMFLNYRRAEKKADREAEDRRLEKKIKLEQEFELIKMREKHTQEAQMYSMRSVAEDGLTPVTVESPPPATQMPNSDTAEAQQ